MNQKPHLRITFAYLVTASLWILFSDSLLYAPGSVQTLLARFSVVKGMLFVLVTSAILYVVLRRQFALRFQLEAALEAQIQQVRRSQLALEQSEKRFRTAVEEAPLPMMIFAEDGSVLNVNRAWTDISGYSPEQLRTTDAWTELAYGADKQPVKEGIDRLFSLETRVDEGDFTITTRDGSRRIWKFSSTPLGRLPDNRRIVVSIATDITERVQAEQKLVESEHFVNSVLLAVPNFIFIYDILENRDVFANDGAQAFLGFTGDEMLGMGENLLSQLVHPDDFPEIQAHIEQIRQHEFKDKASAVVVRVRHKDGRWRWLHIQSVVFKCTEAGDVQQVVGSAIDITERKEAESFALENERLKARFQKEQERNALVQRIISALSHDLRTPLAVITTSTDMLRLYFDRMTASQRLEKLDTIGRQAQFALELLEDTVNIARGNLKENTFRPTLLNVAALCRVSVDEIRASKQDSHRLSFTNLSGLETAVVDEVLVSRILLNLLSNAVKYSPAGSEIRLELEHCNDHIILRVIDQGIGISETDLPHIFEPFYRAESVTDINGTGLGLSIFKDCVERHRGTIQVESALGQGTTFTVQLPYVPVTEPVAVTV